MKYLYTMKQVVKILGKNLNRITKKDVVQFFKYVNIKKKSSKNGLGMTIAY